MSDAERARDVWDGDFGEDEKGEFCDAVGSGGWHGGRLFVEVLVWVACLDCLFGFIGWLDGCLVCWVEVGEMDGCGLGSHNLYWWYWGMVEGLASGTVREVCT